MSGESPVMPSWVRGGGVEEEDAVMLLVLDVVVVG